MFYSLFLPAVAVGANKVMFDLFNASGSASTLKLHSVQPIVDGSVAVVGALGINLFLTRTSAVGTTGTAATREGTDPTAATISCLDGSAVLDNNITARSAPGGGATAGAVLDYGCVFGEETSSAAYNVGLNLARIPGVPDVGAVTVAEGTGVRVVQGAVAATGNVAFNVVFEVVKK